MDISIELVFLFACALFVLHFIINECRCGYTNVEGFECGSCPWSSAKCPPECPATSTEKCGLFGLTGHGAKYECACKDANFAGGAPVCLDTGSSLNLDIGILDLWVDYSTRYAKKYKLEEIYPDNPQSVWKEYTMKGATLNPWSDDGIVNDNDKLLLLTKLSQAPYYIQNIAISRTLPPPGSSVHDKGGHNIGVKTSNNDKGKHFYFSDRTGDAYCLSVTTHGGSEKEFPHKVSFNSHDSHIQYLGYKESNVPFCSP